jgi:hypothetical protein
VLAGSPFAYQAALDQGRPNPLAYPAMNQSQPMAIIPAARLPQALGEKESEANGEFQ